MDELIVRLLRGEATDIEVRRVQQWRAAPAENEEAYREIVRLWERSAVLKPSGLPSPPAVERIVGAAETRRRRARWPTSRRLSWLVRAAAVIALAALGYRAFAARGPEHAPTVALAPLESSLGPDRVMTVSLSDGSIVRAAPETHLEFPAATDRRRVILEGRAFFAVAHADLPFEVQTPAGTIDVTGTRFEVSTTRDGARVVVVEGVVEVGDGEGTTRVAAGQVAFLTRGSVVRVLDHTDVWTLLDWSGGLLVFQSTPLREVAAEVGRQFGVSVHISDDVSGARRITAWFENEPLEEVVAALCIVADVRCEVGSGGVTIGR